MKTAVVACAFSLMVGCKTGVPKSSFREPRHIPAPAADETHSAVQPSHTEDSAEWKPLSKGSPYQLTLMNGGFGFCDDTGSQRIDLTTGRQTASASTCDHKKDAIKNGCGDQVDIVSLPDGPYDTVSLDRYSFRLHGHVRDCDRDGNLVIVSTTGETVLMDASANKIAFIKTDLPDTVVIGSGWAAWNSQDKQAPLRLEKVQTILEHATTPKE